jgi:hypothetical protein
MSIQPQPLTDPERPDRNESDDPVRNPAIETRKRADAIRRTLEGYQHNDSVLLVAEDRQR